jgi:outer membrane immunogenic protein
MTRGVISIAAASWLLATGAFAADLPMQTYTKTPMFVEPVFNWTGFYIGGNIGYSWGRSSDASTLTNTAGTALFASTGTTELNGVVGGGQIGYNWQIQNWVWGLEADIQGTNEKGTRNFLCSAVVCLPPAASATNGVAAAPGQKIDWFGTVRGRVGVLVAPPVLLYATGGLAYGEVDTSEAINALTPFSGNNTNVGWTAGAGIEGAIGGGWTARLEYLYVDLGTVKGSFLTPITALGGGVISSNYSSHITDSVVRLGINYKFGGPLVAKY